MLALICGLAAGSVVQAGPRAHAPSPILTLGELTKLERAVGRFPVVNRGDAPLRLLSATPDCSCTVVSFDREIAPGATGFVETSMDISDVRGRMNGRIVVVTNDPASPRLSLTLVVEVVGGVNVLPDDQIHLVNRPGQIATGRRVIRKDPSSVGDLVVSSIAPSVAWLQASARELTEPRPAGDGLPEILPGDWLFEVAVTGEPAYGAQRASIRFATGLSREPLTAVAVTTDLRSPVNLSKSSVVLSAEAPSDTIVVSVREGADPAALRVEARPPALQVELEPVAGRFFRVEVAGSDALSGQPAAIIFRLGAEQLRLPVEWQRASR
jgi:hypothetical protein